MLLGLGCDFFILVMVGELVFLSFNVNCWFFKCMFLMVIIVWVLFVFCVVYLFNMGVDIIFIMYGFLKGIFSVLLGNMLFFVFSDVIVLEVWVLEDFFVGRSEVVLFCWLDLLYFVLLVLFIFLGFWRYFNCFIILFIVGCWWGNVLV